jgi:hypothetical protein
LKLKLNDLDPSLLRLSRLVSDLHEDLKRFEMITERISHHIGKNDPVAELEEKTNLEAILQGLKDQHKEVLRHYRQTCNMY